MKILFAGNPEIAVPSLEALASRHRIVGVLTNPESQSGRGRSMADTPVARTALSLAGGPVPVLRFERLGSEARAVAAALEADIVVSFAYGKIFGPRFLALFPRGGLNVHPSLLPKYRGAAPIPAAILARDSETGVCVQRIALQMDTGDIFACERIPLQGRETSATLSAMAASVGARLVLDVVDALEALDSNGADGTDGTDGTDGATLTGAGAFVQIPARPQQGEPSYCAMLSKTDGLIDWNRSALDIDAQIRAYDPWPVAYTSLKGLRLSILEAEPLACENTGASPGRVLGLDKSKGIMVQTKDGVLAVRRLRVATRKALPFKDFANGVKDLVGSVLGEVPYKDTSSI